MYVYPRLPLSEAMPLVDRLLAGDQIKWSQSHPGAIPNEVGTVVSEKQLTNVREAVLAATSQWYGTKVGRADAAAWDRAVGEALHDNMSIIPSDAGHPGPWAFMTLVLLPDIAQLRFSKPHPERLLGTHRNTFRRCWWRHHILGGDSTPAGAEPLGEDELVNIFERSRMARDHRLARYLATAIVEYQHRDRSDFARRLTRSVRARTGVLLLDAISESDLRELIKKEAALAAAGSSGESVSDDSGSAGPPRTPSGKSGARRSSATASSSKSKTKSKKPKRKDARKQKS